LATSNNSDQVQKGTINLYKKLFTTQCGTFPPSKQSPASPTTNKTQNLDKKNGYPRSDGRFESCVRGQRSPDNKTITSYASYGGLTSNAYDACGYSS
jgi:hypothetical protein